MLKFRLRFLVHILLYVVGFVSPWNFWYHLDEVRTWQVLAAYPSRVGWLSFGTATIAVLIVAILFTFTAAALRTWATAYIGASIVKSPAMHAETVVASGPYRYVRNPLYLGIFLHTLALAALMPPTGAIFTVVTVALFDIWLIVEEESFLTRTLGEPYRAYCAAVPRLIPSLRPRIPQSSAAPTWGTAFLGEIYFWGVFLAFLLCGWGYNAILIIQGILVSLGIGMIARVFLPAAPSSEATAL